MIKSFSKKISLTFITAIAVGQVQAQDYKTAFQNIYNEGMANKSLELLAHQFIDVIGPRLVGSPQMQLAHDFVKNQYQDWGIESYNEQWGKWLSWDRGISHIDMTYPRVYTLEATQMAWCPNMKKPVEAEVILLPYVPDSLSFARMVSNVKGKFVMIAPPQFSARPNDTWEKFVGKAGADSVAKLRQEQTALWNKRIANTGFTSKTLPKRLEEAGAAGIIANTWSDGWGVSRLFMSRTEKIPSIEMGAEDYSLLARLLENGTVPKLKVHATSKTNDSVPAYNTMAVLKGKEKADEIVMLSAHIDSWDGGTGATDNGTGVLTMMEAMRILKKILPNPKRTIMVGHWGSEEQGLNGSRSFTEDHPELLDKISLVLNQDNGTGKINNISTQGYLNAYVLFDKWIAYLPQELKGEFKMSYPGFPDVGGSDNAAFNTRQIPSFYLGSTNDWNYRSYTWHTRRDTYDKIVFDELRQNAMLVAMLAYMASEEPKMLDRTKIQMPIDVKTGKEKTWPSPGTATRKGPK